MKFWNKVLSFFICLFMLFIVHLSICLSFIHSFSHIFRLRLPDIEKNLSFWFIQCSFCQLLQVVIDWWTVGWYGALQNFIILFYIYMYIYFLFKSYFSVTPHWLNLQHWTDFYIAVYGNLQRLFFHFLRLFFAFWGWNRP